MNWIIGTAWRARGILPSRCGLPTVDMMVVDKVLHGWLLVLSRCWHGQVIMVLRTRMQLSHLNCGALGASWALSRVAGRHGCRGGGSGVCRCWQWLGFLPTWLIFIVRMLLLMCLTQLFCTFDKYTFGLFGCPSEKVETYTKSVSTYIIFLYIWAIFLHEPLSQGLAKNDSSKVISHSHEQPSFSGIYV